MAMVASLCALSCGQSRASDTELAARLGMLRTWKHVVRDPIAWVLLAPSSWLFVFWTLVLVATVVNGGWPHAHHGWPGSSEWEDTSIDPNQLGFIAALPFFGIFALYATVPLGVAQGLIALVRPKLRRAGVFYASFVGGSLLVYATVAWDMLGAWTWFID
jgi:hypothetical protein